MSAIREGVPSWRQFVLWMLCGASASFVLVGAFTIGLLGLPIAFGFAAAAVLTTSAKISAVGAIAGPAVWAFVIAWLNRQGPGTVCTTSSTSTSCADLWSPWPFLAIGLLLVAAPTIYFANVMRRRAALRLA